MSGENVIRLDPGQRSRSSGVAQNVPLDRVTIALLVILSYEALMFAGLVAAFLLTKSTAGTPWPPPGPWFPAGNAAVNTAALLASAGLVYRAGRLWDNREARVAPVVFAAIALGVFFVFFQALGWHSAIGQGLTLGPGHHAGFFYVIVGMHGVHTVGALLFMAFAWLRLRPFAAGGEPRGSLGSSAFSAARVLWYFAVGLWPVLYLLLFF